MKVEKRKIVTQIIIIEMNESEAQDLMDSLDMVTGKSLQRKGLSPAHSANYKKGKVRLQNFSIELEDALKQNHCGDSK